jgi:phenylacetic acid degradation operon negative regulatory protein
LFVRPTPKHLILDLLSSTRGRAVPVKALVAAGALFGITPQSVRVALTRLRERGTIARNERGQYGIAAAAVPVQRHVGGWARLAERIVAWQGGWIGVHTAGLPQRDRTGRRRRERALHFLGFRRLEAQLFVRPDNLAGGIEAVRSELHALGLERAASIFAMSQLDAATEARARGLWDARALRDAYRRTGAALARSARRLTRLPSGQAMVESFALGGSAIRQLALDPLLPEPLVPAAERAALIAVMRDYDRRGRACWRPLMQAHGAPHLEQPRTAVDTGWPTRAAGGVG